MVKGLLLKIKDKEDIADDRFCPPHYLPHKIPIIQELVTDEPCHIHYSRLRKLHHDFFCRYLKCPNYEFMMKKYNEKINSKKQESK